MKFSDYGFKKYINDGLAELGFFEATPIQEIIIPKAISGESLIGKSATGTGKTHAFLLPIFQKLKVDQKEIQAVIISPTRELATQLYEEVCKITKFNSEIDVKLYVGGTDRDNEVSWLEKKQPQIVVSTIGKLKDLAVDTNVLKIYTARMVVIDEADMVFESSEMEVVDAIFSLFDEYVQTLVFSATISKQLVAFLNKYLSKSPLYDLSEKKISKDSIEHIFIPAKNKNKFELLYSLLQTFTPYLVLIFANTKEKVNEIASFLASRGLQVVKLSGDLEARERKQVLKRIKDGKVQYVVASDLAARGMDITGVSHVINFELPKDIEFYTHRTGRTARFDGTGQSISFYEFSDDTYLHKLEAKGLKCVYMAIKDGNLVPTKERNKIIRKASAVKKMEEQLHYATPMPKKVKPGYKKKRKEEIERKLKKFKRKRIEEIYRKKNKKND